MDGLWFRWAAAGSPRSAHEPVTPPSPGSGVPSAVGRQQLQSNSRAGVCPAG